MKSVTTVYSAFLISLLLSACGAKESNKADESLFKVPDDAVTDFSCQKIYKHKQSTIQITEEAGSKGSIGTPCGGAEHYKLNPAIPNLNVVDIHIQKYFVCKDKSGKATHGWMFQHNLAKGETILTLSTAKKGNYLMCRGSFNSPLPTTIVTNDEIQQLIKSRNNQQIANCEQSKRDYLKSIESCANQWVYATNLKFTDDNGSVHTTSRKQTWNSSIY